LRSFEHRLRATGIVLGLLVGICGAGGAFAEETSAASTTTTSGTSATPATSSTLSLVLARSEILPASAYPSGWKSYGTSTEFKGLSYFAGFPEHDAALLASCLQIPTTNIQTNPVEIAGQRYNGRKSSLAVSENLEVFRSADVAAIDAEAAGNPRTPICNKHLPGSQTGSERVDGVTIDITDTTIAVRSIGHFGDQTADLEISQRDSIPKYKTAFRAYSDLVYVQKGRSEAVLFFSNQNAPVPSNFIAELTQAAGNKLTPQ
jgi:hypothetical protein